MIYKISSGNLTDINGETIYIDDLTGNVGDITYSKNEVGGYTPTTNVDGYTPGYRSSVALFLDVKINGTTGVKTIGVNPSNHLTVSRFEVPYVEDGHYIFKLYAINHVLEVTQNDITNGTYGNGSWMYDSNLNRIVAIEGGSIVVKTQDELFKAIVPVAVNERLITIGSSKKMGHLVTKRNEELLSKDCDPKSLAKIQRRYDDIYSILRGSTYEFYDRGNKTVAQRNMEYLNSIIHDH